ncbi:protein obstructor-E-like isoform X1 [Mizuhopecten yessoensis]|uniref:protein obstructor-E-like isoform X1 n=1 Tax=Mizuhopecten yessoensis TaxID=6573 RepID=UPI000B457F49|nr:protein obstructor-E-like isoform X1 [Mizuhopecten yessoensis]
MIFQCFLIFLLHGVVDCAVNCNVHGDGNYEISCYEYTTCVNGVPTVHTCLDGQMYNPNTQQCDHSWNVPPPCNIVVDCTNKPDFKFADLETSCRSYYTCHNGYFYGHNFCSPGLVFDESMQICNWPFNVVTPCGTIDNNYLVG